jgi:DNA-binding MarR family transcriptional regulator
MGTPPDRDEVDDLVASWRRVRPDLPTEPLEVLSRVKRVSHQLDQGRRAAFAGHGLQMWEFDVLAALRRSGEPYQLSPGQLLKQNHVTSGTMTNRVDRLATRGLVERQTDPADGRGVIVRLTEAGMTVVDAALADLLAWEETQLGALDRDDRDLLATLLRRLLLAVADA